MYLVVARLCKAIRELPSRNPRACSCGLPPSLPTLNPFHGHCALALFIPGPVAGAVFENLDSSLECSFQLFCYVNSQERIYCPNCHLPASVVDCQYARAMVIRLLDFLLTTDHPQDFVRARSDNLAVEVYGSKRYFVSHSLASRAQATFRVCEVAFAWLARTIPLSAVENSLTFRTYFHQGSPPKSCH